MKKHFQKKQITSHILYNKIKNKTKLKEKQVKKQVKKKKRRLIKMNKGYINNNIKDYIKQLTMNQELTINEIKKELDNKYKDNNISTNYIRTFINENNLNYKRCDNSKYTGQKSPYFIPEVVEYIKNYSKNNKGFKLSELNKAIEKDINIKIPYQRIYKYLIKNNIDFERCERGKGHKKTNKTNKIDSTELLDIAQRIIFLTHNGDYTIQDLKDIIDREYLDNQLSLEQIKEFLLEHHLDFMEEENNKIKLDNDQNNKFKISLGIHGRGFALFTQKVSDYITSLDLENLTLEEISNLLYNKYKDERFKSINRISEFLDKWNLPYKKLDSDIKNDKNLSNNNNEIIKDININDNMKDDNLVNEDKVYKERVDNVRKEINEVLNQKYKEQNCDTIHKYNTKDYINALEIIKYINQYYSEIVKKENDQHEIMNMYQMDIIHEMENVLSAPGDTTLQDKLHVLREERRQVQYDLEDLDIIKNWLDSINILKVSDTIDRLKRKQKNRQDVKYRVNVDNALVDKYEWAVKDTERDVLRNRNDEKIIGSYNVTPLLNTSTKLFRVSANISYDNNDKPVIWTKNYTAVNDKHALELGKRALNYLKKLNNHIIKIDNIKVEENK